MKVAGTASVGAVTQDTVQLPDYQGRRKVWKSRGGGVSSNVVELICPPDLNRVNWSAKSGEVGDRPLALPGSDGS